jgi:hypothetical protein
MLSVIMLSVIMLSVVASRARTMKVLAMVSNSIFQVFKPSLSLEGKSLLGALFEYTRGSNLNVRLG